MKSKQPKSPAKTRTKASTASELGRGLNALRWAGKTAKQRSEHCRLMVAAREAKREAKRAAKKLAVDA
jgi:hypothetical protein